MDDKIILMIILAIIAVIFFAFYLMWQIKKNGLRKVAVDLIVYAEDNFKNNYDKFNYCVDQLIKVVPTPFSLFITDDMVCNLVQNTFDLCKKALDYKGKEK